MLFLELAGYYRIFVPNFASIAAPLSDLPKKGEADVILEHAFQQLKTTLTSTPVLHNPDPSSDPLLCKPIHPRPGWELCYPRTLRVKKSL